MGVGVSLPPEAIRPIFDNLKEPTEQIMLYIYIIFGIGLILFIRTGNQSTQNYYKFLDYLTEVEFLKNPQVQINRLASPEISKQIPTTKVQKNVSRTTPTNQSDP